MSSCIHPLDPLQPSEISLTARILEHALPEADLRFKVVDVQEPRKRDLIPYIEAERLGRSLPPKPARLIYSMFHRRDTGAFVKALINIDSEEVLSIKELSEEIQVNEDFILATTPATFARCTVNVYCEQAPVDIDELIEMERVCLTHPAVVTEIEKMNLPAGVTVCTDPWAYGTDDHKEHRRLFQCYMYIVENDHDECNHYSLPCAFSPVFDALSHELLRIDYLPLGKDHSVLPTTKKWKPVKTVQYAHGLLDTPTRTDVKPYIVHQPQGPSFHVDGNLVSWQKWRFRVGFNYREGLVINNVTYDGRNVFYRLSLSEMTVPYGDPRAPYHRKQAFDVGDVGLGVTANQLSLGCDCLGHIQYFDACRSDSKGNPLLLKNVICLHEQDAGLLHKHTNYRTNSATVVRNRQLVVQMICTVSNYEYIFAWIFDQAAGIEFEVRATGILSTMPMDTENGATVPWGTNVGPGVMAAYHQHLFSLRIDPAIDGFNNSVTYEDSVAMPKDGQTNPFGVGYVTEEQLLSKPGYVETDVARARVFKIRNDNIINKISHKPVAYKIQTLPSQMMLMDPSSFNARRAHFATHPVWVTKYRDDELFAAGDHTNQSKQDTGLSLWAYRDENLINDDVVFWHTFALTHNPRPEDFPVMPVERISVHLKPSGFFEQNPALDVPASTQLANQSRLQPSAKTNGVVHVNGCCDDHTGVNGTHNLTKQTAVSL